MKILKFILPSLLLFLVTDSLKAVYAEQFDCEHVSPDAVHCAYVSGLPTPSTESNKGRYLKKHDNVHNINSIFCAAGHVYLSNHLPIEDKDIKDTHVNEYSLCMDSTGKQCE